MAETSTLTSTLHDTLNGETVAIAKLADVAGGLAVNLISVERPVSPCDRYEDAPAMRQ